MHCSLSAVLVMSSHSHFISYSHSPGTEEEAVCCCVFVASRPMRLSAVSPCQSQPPLMPSFLSSIHLSIHQPAIRPFVHHPLFSVLCEAACWCCVSFLLSSCKCECYKLALWKAVPLEELHRNVTTPHAFT